MAFLRSSMPLSYQPTTSVYQLSMTEARKNLRNIITDPQFDPQRDADLAKLLDAIRVRPRQNGVGNERQQLKATIRGCVSLYELRAFLEDSEDRYRFFTSDHQRQLSRETVPPAEASVDHLEHVAERIYDIRNRIVHTKAGYEDAEPLLPFDQEARQMQHDIDLVQFLARKVLEESSRPIKI
jgi:hypothetical protein